MITTEQIKELQYRLEALKGYLHIQEKRAMVLEEERQTHSTSFWDDPKKAEVFLKKHE